MQYHANLKLLFALPYPIYVVVRIRNTLIIKSHLHQRTFLSFLLKNISILLFLNIFYAWLYLPLLFLQNNCMIFIVYHLLLEVGLLLLVHSFEDLVKNKFWVFTTNITN